MDEAPNLADVDAPEEELWFRVSPLAILYFAQNMIVFLLNNVVYMIPALIVLWDEIKANPFIAIAIVLGLLLAAFSVATALFWVFRYRLSAGTVEVKSGIIKKKQVNLPFNRIQNVKIEQPFYYRPFKHAIMSFDSGGSLQQEAKLIALPLDFARELKREIDQYKKDNLGSDIDGDVKSSDKNLSQHATAATSHETVVNTRSIGDLVMHGVTSNRMYIFIAALLPFTETIIQAVADWLISLGVDVQHYWDASPVWQIALGVIVLLMTAIAIMTVLSIIASIIIFYGFTLSRTDEKFIRRNGLITKHEVSVSFSRIQVAVMKQDWLDILFGRINLKLEQLNAQLHRGPTEQANNKLMIPSVFNYECRDILNIVFPQHGLHDRTFSRISRIFITRNLLWFVLPITIGLGVGVWYDAVNPIFAVLMSIALSGLVILRWLRWGYAFNDEYLYVKKGLFGVDKVIIPIHKVQRITLVQSVFMQKRGIMSVRFQLASGYYKIPLIDEATARQIQSVVLYKVEAQGQSWM